MGSCISTSSSSSFSPKRTKPRRAKSSSVGSGSGSGAGSRRNHSSRRSYRSIAGEACEEELHRLPGRLFLNSSSDVACLHSQQGKKGTNQDAMIVWENFMQRSDTIFCGVFDGHGPFGHMVAKKIRDSLPVKLSMQWRAKLSGQDSPQQNVSRSWSMDSEEISTSSMDGELIEPIDSDEKEKVPEMYLPLKKSFLKAFQLMDKELKFHPTLDCFCSGSTAVTLVKQGLDLVIGNVGDSRAIIATRDCDNNLVAVQLTVDLKPNLPREAARIQQCKGRVFALQDEPEVARVWLPNNDSPGLAMARAFGDFCLKDYGLISVPDITYRHLTEKDEFIVLATDGVWDVLSNKEVVDVVASAPTRGTAARALVDCAVRAWRLKFPTSKIDDCAVVCLYLDSPSSIDPSKVGDSKTAPEPGEITVSSFTCKLEEEETHHIVNIGTKPTALTLKQSYSLHDDADEIVPVCETTKEEVPGKSKSTRSLADCISIAEDEEWSALEGVTRVNSLVNLPRFLSTDRKPPSWKKWF